MNPELVNRAGRANPDALLHTRIGKVLHDSLAIGAIGELPPEDGQVVLRARVLDVGQELAALAHERQAPTDQTRVERIAAG